MTKWFEVKVEIWKTVLVEVSDTEDEEIATQSAYDEFLHGSDGQVSEAVPVVGDEAISRSRRHADVVIEY
jgi:hypothetical protein